MAWEHVEVHVEDVLASSLAVSEEEVDSVAPKIRRPQGGRGELSNAEQLCSVLDTQIDEVRRVTTRHDEHVPANDGLDVHECRRSFVLVDDADLGLSSYEATEEAISHCS